MGKGSFWMGSPSERTEGALPFCRGITMEGDCLSCMKYLMFVFNFFIFVSIPGTCLGFSPGLCGVGETDCCWLRVTWG